MKNDIDYLNESYSKISKNIRKKVLKMVTLSQSPHIGSALSIVEILVSLYFGILNVNPMDPKFNNRDRFILSKGHASAALYATLSEKGFLSEDLLEKYSIDGGSLSNHLDRNISLGIEAASGSLGHGLSIALGMAIAAKHDKKTYKCYVLMGDGECNEGSVWEAALLASQLKLDNLVVIIDYNKIQGLGPVEDIINLEPLSDKWNSFGWTVTKTNGHDFKELLNCFESLPLETGKPSVIIAYTTKGKGISFMENKLEWHYFSPTLEQYEAALREIDLS
jgi:transketolase